MADQPQRSLTVFFSLQSPWSYLGHAAAMDVVARHALRIDWRPVDLVALFPETGGLPLAKRHPSRRAYRDIELQRWRDRLGLPLKLRPAFWPLDIALADRVVVATASRGGDPDPYVRAAFSALWVEDRNLADQTVLADLIRLAGLDPSILDAAESEETRAGYAANTDAARAAGVFGAPTYILNDELFWGQDRIPLLDEALASRRSPYRP